MAEIPQSVSFQIGDTIKPAFCPASQVVGIDYYSMDGFNGQRITWDSYTLTSDESGVFARWWIVNVHGRGAYYYIPVDEMPEGVTFIRELSGLVGLDSRGDAALSSDKGALAVYGNDKGELFAEEVFDGADRIVFYGRPYSPSP